jgi:proteic killer suppression protein
MAIVSFGDARTEALFAGSTVTDFPPELCAGAKRKLQAVDYAVTINDLRVPPGNHLEKLQGSLQGWYSIRVNQKWRIIFEWDNGAHNVEVIDYHA